MSDNPQVSQAMIEAGARYMSDNGLGIMGDGYLEDLYLAMNAARTIDDAPDFCGYYDDAAPIKVVDDAPDARPGVTASDWLVRQFEMRPEIELMREAARRFADEYLPSGLRETPKWLAVIGENK